MCLMSSSVTTRLSQPISRNILSKSNLRFE